MVYITMTRLKSEYLQCGHHFTQRASQGPTDEPEQSEQGCAIFLLQ